MAEGDGKGDKGNGFSHITTIISIVLGAGGVLISVMLAIVSGIGARIDDVRTTTLSLREHAEYQKNQERITAENREEINRIRDRIFALQHELDAKACPPPR